MLIRLLISLSFQFLALGFYSGAWAKPQSSKKATASISPKAVEKRGAKNRSLKGSEKNAKKKLKNKKTDKTQVEQTEGSEKKPSLSLRKEKIKPGSKNKSKSFKRLGVDQSDFMPEAGKFGVILSYSFDFDSLQTTDPPQLNHYLGVSGTFSIDRNFSAFVSMSASHRSENFRVIRRGPNDNFHEISNLSLGTIYAHQKNPSWVVRNALTFSSTFPLSERSRVDQQFINLNLAHYIQSKPWMRLSLYNRLRANFLGNRLRFSVWDNDGFSGGRTNRDWLVQNAIGVNFKVAKRIGIRSSFTVNNTRFLDNSWNLAFGNQISIFANYSGFQFFLQMFNSSYPENESLQILYYDPYRRFFAGGLTYAF